MIPADCRRLAEVDFPIAEVSRHAVREKSIRHGHPSTLHVWWARRPLASSRAMLMALLLPDPLDERCPDAFKDMARRALLAMRGRERGWDDETGSDAGLRAVLLRFIADFSNWDHSAKPEYLDAARALVCAAHGPEAPLVADPFAGGGSIPLEALRLGCDAFASDLNPVACLILKVLLEDIPRGGPDLAEEVRGAGRTIRDAAQRELADLYPMEPDGATPIAWLWARTVRCEAPSCGAEIPLLKSFWLCRKRPGKRTPARLRALRAIVANSPSGPAIDFEVFEPESTTNVKAGTVTGGRARCLACGAALAQERVRSQLASQRGGADVVFDDKGRRVGGARMTAVVTTRPGEPGRHYRKATDADYAAVQLAQQRLGCTLDAFERNGLSGASPIPDESLPPIGTLGFRVQRYGMREWGDLFTSRQKTTLATLTEACHNEVADGMAIALSRFVNRSNHLARWDVGEETVVGAFARQALAVVWDFAEANPLSRASGGYDGQLRGVVEAISSWPSSRRQPGVSQIADATAHPLPTESAAVWFTDPPYYDAIPYADLADFFLVWLKRALPGHPLLRDPFDSSNLLSPKEREAVQDKTKKSGDRVKDRLFFEERMEAAFAEGRRVLREDGVGAVVFAHKTTDGWEAMLSGLIRGGWTITASWPIATEMGARLRARDSAALATSVHLVLRPRPADAAVGDWGDILGELPGRVGEWMERLTEEGVRGADLVFACIGPALDIFSRYSRAEAADGREITLREYLERVWEVVGRTALENVLGTAEAPSRNGAAGALEEDARLAALFLWTLQDTAAPGNGNGGGGASGYALPYDVVRRFAQPLGIDLEEWEGRIVETKKGVVRLKTAAERAEQLLGADGADGLADEIERARDIQLTLFPDEAPAVRGRRGKAIGADGSEASRDPTTLDRVHAAMLRQASGQSAVLRAMLNEERERGTGFERLANALSALYHPASGEKRLLDAMLLAMPRPAGVGRAWGE